MENITETPSVAEVKTAAPWGQVKRLVVWLATNGAMCWCLYAALWLGNNGAANLLKFFIVFNFVASGICFAVKETREKLKKKGASIPPKANIVYGLLFSGTLAYFGWFGYATFDLITTMFQLGIYGEED